MSVLAEKYTIRSSSPATHLRSMDEVANAVRSRADFRAQPRLRRPSSRSLSGCRQRCRLAAMDRPCGAGIHYGGNTSSAGNHPGVVSTRSRTKRWQVLGLDVALRQRDELAHQRDAMRRQAIPHDEQRTLHVAHQRLQTGRFNPFNDLGRKFGSPRGTQIRTRFWRTGNALDSPRR